MEQTVSMRLIYLKLLVKAGEKEMERDDEKEEEINKLSISG